MMKMLNNLRFHAELIYNHLHVVGCMSNICCLFSFFLSKRPFFLFSICNIYNLFVCFSFSFHLTTVHIRLRLCSHLARLFSGVESIVIDVDNIHTSICMFCRYIIQRVIECSFQYKNSIIKNTDYRR